MSPTTSPRRALLRRLLLLLVVTAAVVAAQVWYGNRHHFLDLRIYVNAMRWWHDGHPLYEFAHDDPIQGRLGFTYPPFAALVLAPLGVIGFRASVFLFWAGSAAAVIVTTFWLVKPIAKKHGTPLWFALLLALPLVSTLEPIRETVNFGQINMLLVLLVLTDLLIIAPRWPKLAGIGIGVAAAIKLTPAIFIVYLLITRRWRAALTATATAAGATLLAAAVAWNDSWHFWTAALWETGRVGHTDRIANQSILGVLARLSDPADPNRLVWLALVAVVTGYGLWRARKAALAGDEVVGLTLTGFVGGLVSPITWPHHLFWFVPALLVLVDVAAGQGGSHRRPGLFVLAGLCWASVTVSVISLFELGLSKRLFADGVPGFLIVNWYVLLTAVLIVALPVRARPVAVPAEPERPVTPRLPVMVGTSPHPG
ncbi:glycosyltransferase 87 family protein [Virgisporangium ochraceum]|uniref:Membrane protein n=1 Tax=Virgisporangium ochraceum TaxID=65505 RepID=A0A8J3ZYG2_9ACTN|nr:glycosyltransferase 87 family protein [Virgisporangium ochraceum]GIJ71941.1 membrane protein [Virgisporangium ochraceum]